MNISSTKILPAALPPSVMGGGNAPSNSPASGDPFANFIAQLSGSGGTRAAGQTPAEDSARTSRARGVAGAEEIPEGMVPSTDDGSDPAAVAVAIPVWLWAVPHQPTITGASTLTQSPNGPVVSGEQSPSTRPGDVNPPGWFGVVATLSPETLATSPAAVPGQPAAPSIQADSSNVSTGAADATVVVAAGVTAGASAIGAEPTVPANADASATLGSALPASTNQPGPTVSTVQTSRAGRVPMAHGSTPATSASAAESTSDLGSVRGVVPDPNAVAGGRTASLAETLAASARVTDHLRPGDRAAGGGAVRGANVSSPVADGQSALVAALISSRAQNETTHGQPEQDAEAFADPRARTNDVQMAAVQALDGTGATTRFHVDHASAIATGQLSGQTASVEKTGLASEVVSIASGADRSAALESGNVHRQMVQAIQLQSRNGIGDARLTLRPEYLGEVTIALRVENGAVTAHVSASASDVRAWLTANEALLRTGLSEQGLTLQRLIVSDEPAEAGRDGKGSQGRQQQSRPDDEPRSRPRPRPETSTFEITV